MRSNHIRILKALRSASVGLSLFVSILSCQQNSSETREARIEDAYADSVFFQEYHEAYPLPHTGDGVRSIAVDSELTVWIATGTGIYMKRNKERDWVTLLAEADRGPSFSVVVARDSSIWMSTWKTVYRYQKGELQEMPGAAAPVSVLAPSDEGVYALGPRGISLFQPPGWQKKNYQLARSIRDAVSDEDGGLWVASDVGLYHVGERSARHYYTPEHMVSAYIRGVAQDYRGNLWVAGLGGVSILSGERKHKSLVANDGIPSVQVNAVERAPDGMMWVGTDKGVVRFDKDYGHTLRFSRRWLISDKVNDIAFDKNGDAWIATNGGVSAIKKKQMTLRDKADYFYDVLMRRHIRAPWIAGQCKLPVPGDTTVWEPDDDDNDGEYTGNYLAMESFRFAATGSLPAKENAAKAFRFLKFLQEVTGTDGFFARTIVPSHWKTVDDGNRIFTERELADELVKEPRFKPVETRWHRSKDGKWLWKGDTSSDEMCGHMMGYFFYYELAADDAEKEIIRKQVMHIVDHLLSNGYNLIDVDGTHTRWGVWSPDILNADPEWMPDRSINSMELLSFVKLAYHVSGDAKYQDAYLKLIHESGYLNNMANIPNQNPGWFIYFDVMLAAYQYPILLTCEKDPKIVAFYEKHMDAWFEKRKHDGNPLINFIYCYSRNKRSQLAASVSFLQDTPLDLVDWPIDHREREDVTLVRHPVLDDIQLDSVPPASIRGTIRWDKNPFGAVSGNPSVEREPVFWLLPYWMGRYLKMIEPPAEKRR